MARGGSHRTPSPRIVFAWLFVGSAVAAFAVFLLTMLSLLVADTLGLGEAALGIAFASLSIGGLTSPFIAGVFADRAGPRPVSLAGLGSVAAGAWLASISPASWVLVVGEFLLGAGFAMFGVMSYSWINETLGDRKGIYLGLYVSSIVAGLAAAGLSIALFLSDVSSWREFFLAGALLALPPSAALWFLLPVRMGVPTTPKDIRAALRDRDVRWVAGLQYLIGLGGGGFSWLPFFLVQVRGFDLRFAVLAFVGGSILWGVGGIAFGRLADQGWSRPIIVLGGLGTGIAYLAFVLWSEAAVLAIAFLCLYAFLWPAGAQVPLTFLGQRLGPRAQRAEVGLLENLFLAGDATGATLVGFLAGPWSLTWALAGIPGIATLAAGTLFGWVYGLGRGIGKPAARGAVQ